MRSSTPTTTATATGKPSPDGRVEHRWREDRIDAVLDAHGEGALFIAGSAPNQGRFHPRFDAVCAAERAGGHAEIDTRRPVPQVADELEAIAGVTAWW